MQKQILRCPVDNSILVCFNQLFLKRPFTFINQDNGTIIEVKNNKTYFKIPKHNKDLIKSFSGLKNATEIKSNDKIKVTFEFKTTDVFNVENNDIKLTKPQDNKIEKEEPTLIANDVIKEPNSIKTSEKKPKKKHVAENK